MEMRVGRVLVTASEIARRVEALGAEVNAAYGAKPITVVGVLDGVFVFLGDLIRRLEMPLEIILVKVETYGDSMTPEKEPAISESAVAGAAGRHVLVLDDIYDSGRTLAAMVAAVRRAGAGSVRTCVFLEKDRPHDVPVAVDFVGFTVPDEFVVGYGLDFAGKYRNLPYVAALEGRDEGRVIA